MDSGPLPGGEGCQPVEIRLVGICKPFGRRVPFGSWDYVTPGVRVVIIHKPFGTAVPLVSGTMLHLVYPSIETFDTVRVVLALGNKASSIGFYRRPVLKTRYSVFNEDIRRSWNTAMDIRVPTWLM